MKLIGYARVSTQEQAEGGVSLEAQRAKIAAYSTLHDGLELVGIVQDAGVSAKSLNRPGLAHVLAMLDRGEVDGVVVAKLDRLSRSVRDVYALIETYFGERYALVSIAETLDTRTAIGRAMLGIMAVMAQWEREQIGERTRDALLHLKAQGVKLGTAGLGWEHAEDLDSDGRRALVAVPDEVATVGRMQELRADGQTYRRIAETLAAEGRQTKRGGQWHASTVRYALSTASNMEELVA